MMESDKGKSIDQLKHVEERLRKQLEFIVEVDKIKSIFRKTLLFDSSRYENDAEHAWHLAVMAVCSGGFTTGYCILSLWDFGIL